jgi:proteasome accessory factor B
MLGISRRTVFRDLKELRAIGVPLNYEADSDRYTIDPEFFLPPLDLTLQEALTVLLLLHKAHDHIQLPFRDSALLAALKIENNLPAQMKQYCTGALEAISAKPAAQATSHQSRFDQVFIPLQQAIRKKQKVSMVYRSLFENETITLELSPYHLFYNRRAWYVLGHSSMHDSIRTFKINRIEKMTHLKKRFLDGDDFHLQEHLGRAWSMIPEGRIYNVKLRFLQKVAENVTEVHWHSTQQVTRNSDGSATVEFRVDGIGEISWWILGYGDQVEVLAPKALRTRILRTAENMIKLNIR